jgi:hypothetical protein
MIATPAFQEVLVTRCIAIVVVSLCVLTCVACGSSTTSPSSGSRNVTVAFSSLTGSGTPVSTYTESGFSISTSAANWVALTTYGNPAPFIQFAASAGSVVTGQIQVTADRQLPFSFKSVDLYSSVTPIPYVITGAIGSTVVFTLSGTVPNTFGNFRTVVNSHGTDVINTLTIDLSNATGLAGSNPMGLDNIVLSQ